MATQRERWGSLIVFAWCLAVCVTMAACKDSGSGAEASKSDFRLSLSKREVPVASKVVR